MSTLIFFLFIIIGLTIFIFSLWMMSHGLQGFLGVYPRFLLAKLTKNPVTGVVTGALATALVQSSSAVAVMMVALVDAKVLTVYQAFGVILGANIGTTITTQIVSFDLSAVSLPLMISGLFLVSINKRLHSYGEVLVGFGGLFYGLAYIRQALAPILAYPMVVQSLTGLSDHIGLGVLVGIILTAIVQSSSAVTGIVIVLAQENAITLGAAVAVALGSNIGTVATTLISTIGLEREARATAYADLIFNVLGVILILPFIQGFVQLITLLSSFDLSRQIANAHTAFNLVTAIIAIPFIRIFTKLALRWAGIKYPGSK